MDLELQRTGFSEDGVFGELRNSDGEPIMFTLEHAYPDEKGGYRPKVPEGSYTCVRGMHSLSHSIRPFETFEITGVEGHAGILFHVGNYNQDSSGCVLVGMAKSERMLISSKTAFDHLMEIQKGLAEFKLTVVNPSQCQAV